jgi:hypothetical protein
MKKNTLLGLALAGSALLSTIASTDAEAYVDRQTYQVMCTETPSGYSWVKHTVGLMDTFDAAGDCINEGGVPEIKSTNRRF